MKLLSLKQLRIGLVICVLLVITLACGFSTGNSSGKTAQPKEKATATEAVAEPTEVPAEEPTEVIPTDEPTEVIPTDEPMPEGPVVATEFWRIEPMEDATLWANDQTPDLDPDLAAAMEKQARNLAIPKPYFFEIYGLPDEVTLKDVRDHYNTKIVEAGIGMRKAMDTTDYTGIGVMTWVNPSVKTRKYLVQYIPGDEQYSPVTFIIYSNPPKE